MMTRGRIDVAGLSDIGRVRKVNEDQFVVAALSKSLLVKETTLQLFDQTRLFGGSQGHLLMVADGMGGAAAGKDASAIAVDTVTNYVLNTMPWFFRLDQAHEGDLREELQSAIERAQTTVHQLSEGSPSRQGMGTTLTMAYILWPRLYVVHVGDSRCYVLRKLTLRQITRDHTLAQRHVEEGVLTPEEAEESRLANVLLNAIGGDGPDEVQPEVYKTTLEIGDTVLLCSDGLTKHVDDNNIAAILGTRPSARQACRALVDSANADGGEDNITAVVAYFLDAAAELGDGSSDDENQAATARSIPRDPERKSAEAAPPSPEPS